MAVYILCNRVVYDGQELKAAKEIDDANYSVAKLTGAGAVLIQTPNPEVEAWAVRVRHEQIKGIGSWLTSEELSAAFIKAAAGATSKILDVKLSCRLGTTANIVLSGLQVIDGVMTAANDRVFVKAQVAGATNGIYLAKVGAWVRTDDANVSDSVTAGLFSFIEEGATLADTGWVLTANMPIVLDTTPLVFTQFSGAGAGVPLTRALTAGAGLTGGGDLSADRTFDVIANADASIVVNANDIQVGVLATDAQHGVRGGGTQHAAVIPAGASGFMSGADKTKLDGLPVSAVSSTRTITAGAGLTGGGDLSADRTFDVIGNADGSIVANANDVQVGVLATDAQHGVRGGGTQHANATGAVAGFMVAADFTKLGGVAAGATNTPLTAVAPVDVTKAASVVGVSTAAARADHKHDVTTAAAGSIAVGDAAAEGAATSIARSDHTHALAAPAAPANVTKAAANAGAATTVARSDHKHDVSTAAPGIIAVGDAAAEGAATSLARSDHTHALTAPAAPADVTKAAASAGAAATVARSDHKHDVSTAAPSDIGSANAEGAATSLSRSDHVHNLSSAVAKAAATSGLTAGSVPFVTAGPTLSEDNANLNYDDAADRMHVPNFAVHKAVIEDSVISPLALAGPSDDYNPAGLSTARVIRQDCSAAASLTGLTAQTSGQRAALINIATNVLFTLTLRHGDINSAAANRFSLPAGADLVIPAGGVTELWYDGVSSRWRPLSTV